MYKMLMSNTPHRACGARGGTVFYAMYCLSYFYALTNFIVQQDSKVKRN